MNEQSIFDAVLAIDDPTQRSAYLDRACAGAVGLRATVEELLKKHEQTSAATDTPFGAHTPPELPPTLEHMSDETPMEVEATGFLLPANRPEVLGRLDRYEVLEVLGKGGMGMVLRAYDAHLQRPVAIKVMAAHLAVNPTARKRFGREARAAAAICHDNIVTIHAVEETRALPYLVMKYIPGVSLQQRLDRDGPLPLADIVRIGMEMASGLAAAHARGLIHRDIKPANILLETREAAPGDSTATVALGEASTSVFRVKITDFGLARAADDSSLTQTGVVAGTPDYMSPEQARGENLDARTDLFSLGSVLYFMCTRRAPFHADDALATLSRVCDDIPRPIRELASHVPDWLTAIIEKLHTKDPNKRFQSAAEVADLLRSRLAHLLSRPVSTECTLTDGAVSPRANKPRARTKRRVLVASAALLFGCFVAAVAGLIHWRHTVVGVVTPEEASTDRTDPVSRLTAPQASAEKMVLLREIGWPGRHIYNAAFSPDGRHFLVAGSAGPGNTIKVWEVTTGRPALDFTGNEKGVFTPDSKQVLAAGIDRALHLWDVATWQEVRQFRPHDDWINTLDLDRDGTHALAASNDGTVRWYDLTTGNVISEWNGSGGNVHAILARDGRRVLTCTYQSNGRVIDLWDPANGRRLKSWKDAADVRTPLAGFTPDGTQFLSVAADGIRYRNAADGELVNWVTWPADLAPHLSAFGLSGDCRRLVIPCDEGKKICLLELPEVRELCRCDVPTAPYGTMAIAPDYRYVVTADGKGVVYVFGPAREAKQLLVSPNQTLDLAKSRAIVFEKGKQWDKAADEYRRVVEMFEKRLTENPKDACRSCLALAHQQLAGLLLYHLSQPEEAAKSRQRQVALFEQLVAELPKVPAHREQLGHSYRWRAFDLEKMQKPLEAEHAFRLAIEYLESFVRDYPELAYNRSMLADTYDRLRRLLAANGKPEEATKALDETLRTLAGFPAERATTPSIRASVAEFHFRRASLLKEAERLDEAEAAYATAVEMQTKIATEYPKERSYRHELGRYHNWLGLLLIQKRRPKDAETAHRRAFEIYEQLVRENDAAVGHWHRRELAWTCLNLAEALEKMGKSAEAIELYGRAGALCETLTSENADPVYSHWGIIGYGKQTILLAAAGRSAEAEQTCRKLLEGRLEDPLAHFRHALLRLHLGGPAAHRLACAEMLRRFESSTDLETCYWTAWTCTLGPDAVADWARVIQLAEKALAADPNNCDRLQMLAAALYRAGRFEDAVKRLTEAEAAFKTAKNPRSTVIYNWLFHAMARHRLGQAEEAKAWLDMATAAIDQPSEESKDVHAAVWNRRLTLELWRNEAQTLLSEE